MKYPDTTLMNYCESHVEKENNWQGPHCVECLRNTLGEIQAKLERRESEMLEVNKQHGRNWYAIANALPIPCFAGVDINHNSEEVIRVYREVRARAETAEIKLNDSKLQVEALGEALAECRGWIEAKDAAIKRQAEALAEARERIEVDVRYTKEIAESVLAKIQECQYKTGRNTIDPFVDNNVPLIHVNSDAVTLTRDTLRKFHDDYAMMAAYLAHIFKDEHVAPAHLIGTLRKRLSPKPVGSGEKP